MAPSSVDAPAAASTLTDLVRQELEQTAASLVRSHRQQHGGGGGAAPAAGVDAQVLGELSRHMEAVRGYISEAQTLVGAAKAAAAK